MDDLPAPGRSPSKVLSYNWRLRAARDEEQRHGGGRKPTSCSWVEPNAGFIAMDGDFASEPAASKALSDARRLRPARARTTPSRIALKIGFVFMSGAERRGRRTPAGGYAMGMAMR